MSDKKPEDYTKGLRDREMEIKMGIPSQEDMDKLIKFEEKGTGGLRLGRGMSFPFSSNLISLSISS